MATIRTQADLLILLADNITQDISPQDIRDTLVSLQGQMGQIWVSNNIVETNILLDTTYYEANLTGAAISEVTETISGIPDFVMPIAGRLQYKGIPTRHFHCVATISFTTVGVNQEIHFRLAKSGIVSPEAEVLRKVGTGADVGALAIHWITSLAQDEYLSLFAQNITSNANITIRSANLQAVGMLI